MSDPVVSVCVTTYNHGQFIRACLDGVMAQETSFPFEVLLGEDDSTDGTREICKEYADRFPDQIRLFLNSRDQVVYIDGRPTGRWNFVNNLRHARGTYIALLEGDDHWIDSSKLQRQVDLLDEQSSLSGCFGGCKMVDEEAPERSAELRPPGRRESYRLEDILKKNFVHLSSLMFRTRILELPPAFWKVPMGDWPLHLLNLRHGPYGYIDRIMSVYRIHRGGIWSQRSRSEQVGAVMALYRFAREQLGEGYEDLVRRRARAYRFNNSRLGRLTKPLRKRLRLRSRITRLLRPERPNAGAQARTGSAPPSDEGSPSQALKMKPPPAPE